MPRTSRTRPFRLLDLPIEIRLQIYHEALTLDSTLDLHPCNGSKLGRHRLALLLTSHQVSSESRGVFYGANVFRVFPTHGDFFRRPVSLPGVLSRRCRAAMTCLELRIGPGWTAPPRSWTVRRSMGLADLTSLRTLVVFVECDPSHDAFRGFRRGKDFFTLWAAGLLRSLLATLPPCLSRVRLEAYPSVDRQGDLMARLVAEVNAAGKLVMWGPTFQGLGDR
ncbi:MAG: hypothetical protein M1816_001102 [Peltula sp. TS41687]|nr:MAG: hypothetical protein M1816_001102 [Peltula sp. TS41687]